jgi:transposase InsO family protein
MDELIRVGMDTSKRVFQLHGVGAAARPVLRRKLSREQMLGSSGDCRRIAPAHAVAAGTPEGNGCAERFIRTLKENFLWVQTFNTVEDLRRALLEFRQTYNTTWLIERHG